MKSVNKSIRLPSDFWERVSEKAKERGTNVNAAVKEALTAWLNESEPKKAAKVAVATPEGRKLSAPRADTGANWGFNPKGRK